MVIRKYDLPRLEQEEHEGNCDVILASWLCIVTKKGGQNIPSCDSWKIPLTPFVMF